jgi:hypothetical protein
MARAELDVDAGDLAIADSQILGVAKTRAFEAVRRQVTNAPSALGVIRSISKALIRSPFGQQRAKNAARSILSSYGLVKRNSAASRASASALRRPRKASYIARTMDAFGSDFWSCRCSIREEGRQPGERDHGYPAQVYQARDVPALTGAPLPSHVPCARRPDDRCCREMMEESPGSTGIRCRLTAGGGDPRDSATENKPPARWKHSAGKGETGR